MKVKLVTGYKKLFDAFKSKHNFDKIMLLRKIFLENYGLYSGKIEFDLIPRIKYRKERPIILLGGKNGSGKTTLLDAIRLVLYGRAVLGNRVTQREYESFLRNKIYRGKASIHPQTHARVAIEFDFVLCSEGIVWC